MTKNTKVLYRNTVLALLYSILPAKPKKGAFILSGKTDLNFLFSNTTIERDSIATNKLKDNQHGFNLGAGYFVANNFAVAVSGAYSYTYDRFEATNYSPATTETITHNPTVSARMRRWFCVLGSCVV
ncbi:MAG: hypothetical protein WKF59_11505 [Chitinophagaceae bacterium]